IFGQLPAGQMFAIAFYALLSIAALTSTISLLEVVVSYFVDEREWNRSVAAWSIGGVCFVLAVPSALANGSVDFLTTDFLGTGMDFLSLQNVIWGNYSLTLGALLTCLFVAYKWGVPLALESLESSGHRLPASGLWGLLIRFVCPLALAAVLIYILVTGQYF
ncbi:MAG: sodium-dependent transporter, partial [Thermoanaerobaculia bacterium]|nr:sodium-dependent transporter [Thermoanaerobaculia bacterium]